MINFIVEGITKDKNGLEDICKYFNCEVFCKETIGINRWFIMKKIN